MKILAIDPGISTGLCLLNEYPMTVGRLQTGTTSEIRENLTFILSVDQPDIIVCERLPKFLECSGLSDFISFINLYLDSVRGSYVSFVSPGEWKPVSKARSWSYDKCADQHQKDAYSLARFYLWKTKGVP